MSEREEFRLDPNTADEEGLCQLPGVGPAMAERIMAARPFEGADDLMRVSGVGPTVLARMRPFLLPSFAEGEGEQQESEAEQTEGDAVADWPATEAEVVEVKAPEPLAIEGVFAAPVDGEGEAQEVFSLSAEELPAVAESLSAADRILPAAAEEPPVPPPEFGAVAAEALSEIAAEGKEEAPEPSPALHEQGPALPGTGPAPQLAPQRPGLTRCPGRKSRPLRDQLVSPENPRVLYTLNSGFSNGCAFSASTGGEIEQHDSLFGRCWQFTCR